MKQLLEEIIKDWLTKPFPTVKPRTVKISQYFDPKVKKIISVIGFRRTGKTFTLFDFAQTLGKQNCLYINFEDERLPVSTKVLTNLIEVIKELKGNKPLVLLLDEIQEIPNWSKWARRINETTPYNLILSGSSSKLSSYEIPTELRGQTLSLQVFPLSWNEFLSFKGKDIRGLPVSNILNLLREYLFFGGLPEIVLAEEGIKPLILTEYYNTFVQRDVIQRYKIRNPEALRDLLRLILNSRSYTFSKLANTLKSLGHKIGKATVIKYMSYLDSSFFTYSLELCSPSVKNKIQAVKKVYKVDTFFTSRFSNVFSENLGHLMEEAVWQELCRRKAKNPLLEYAYWKDYSQHEVDFVVMVNQKVNELIQVTYAVNLAEIDKRETKALFKAAKDLNCSKLTIITWDFEQTVQENGHTINYVPLSKWLVQEFRAFICPPPACGN